MSECDNATMSNLQLMTTNDPPSPPNVGFGWRSPITK